MAGDVAGTPEEMTSEDRRTGDSSPAERLFDRVCRNPETGQIAIVQRPNAPLLVFFAAAAVRLLARPDGRLGDTVSVVSVAALAWWAVGEVVRGDSLFRRLLGAGVLATMVVGRLVR